MMRFVPLLLMALPLAACGNEPQGNTSFSIQADGEGGNVSISGNDSQGVASIKGPGIEGSIKLPKIDINAADFEIDGVKLYPGSTIKDFNLNAVDRSGEKDEGKVTIAFESPAALDKVQGWFRDAMTQQNFKVSPHGNGFAGTTSDGNPVTLDLEAAGDRTSGRMTVGS
jgi:hypothetical protein